MDGDGMARSGVSDTLEKAKEDFRINWNAWLAWTRLQEVEQHTAWEEPVARAVG
jgi:hypothetical protein